MNYSEQTVGEFLSGIASERVAPAGGTAGAVVGAIGTSLSEMVCIHTAGRDDPGAGERSLVALRADLERQRDHLLRLAAADARTVDELFPAPDDGVDQAGIKRSVGVPLTIADACLTVLRLTAEVTAAAASAVVIDAASGAILVRSALRASAFTARRNVGSVADPSFVHGVERTLTEIERGGDRAYERAMANAESHP